MQLLNSGKLFVIQLKKEKEEEKRIKYFVVEEVVKLKGK